MANRVIAAGVLILLAALTHLSMAADEDVDLATLKTFSAIGKGSPVLNGFNEAELLRHEGKGCLTHMWFGGDWAGYENTRIRVYVDGERLASIDMLLGIGHGYAFGEIAAPWGSQRMGKTGQPSGVYNTHRIPFSRSIRVTAQRDKEATRDAPFWWILRGTENLPVSIAGVRLPPTTRLRLHKREDYTARQMEEFNLCNVRGAGALYQVTIAARGMRDMGGWQSLSFLEACMRAYIDGAEKPTMLSSGLEDYFLGTYYFNRGRYANALAGLTHMDADERTFSAYRFHDEDPVFFKDGLRLTCRCGETEDGSKDGRVVGNPPETTYTTYTWVYQW